MPTPTTLPQRPTTDADDDGYLPDTGCVVSPSCLTCPLPCCRYDDPRVYRAWKQSRVINAVEDGARKRLSVDEIAAGMGATRRTVQRWLVRIYGGDLVKKGGRFPTPRAMFIWARLREGRTQEEIADELGLSTHAIHSYAGRHGLVQYRYRRPGQLRAIRNQALSLLAQGAAVDAVARALGLPPTSLRRTLERKDV